MCTYVYLFGCPLHAFFQIISEQGMHFYMNFYLLGTLEEDESYNDFTDSIYSIFT